MAHLFQVNRVKFLCSCGLLKPITGIYFCRHCLKLRCSNCVSHEVDTLYCSQCSENMPSTEARLKKNRCANCFDCPSCIRPLSTRAASIQSASTDDQSVNITKKVYYLGCTSCRWTSRDAELEDQTIATGGWSERDNPNEKRIQDLFEYYRGLAQKEKFDSDKKRISSRKSTYLSLTEKYSLSSNFSSLMSRKSISTAPFSLKGETGSLLEIEPSVALDEIPGLPPAIFTEPIELSSVTTLEQRLAAPEWQPTKTSSLYPIHKHILVKKSHRCRVCEHNLSKPEYNPSSIKFKIQLGAYYHVPEIRIVKVVELKHEQEVTMQLTLCNPTPHDMTVALLPFVPEAYFENKDVDDFVSPGSLNTCSLIKVGPMPTKAPDIKVTADVSLPQGQMILAARDDTAEYDDADTSSNYKDDPQVVAWRLANKVGVNILVTPKAGCEEAVIGLLLRYDYTNTVATASDNRTVTLNIPAIINVGKVAV